LNNSDLLLLAETPIFKGVDIIEIKKLLGGHSGSIKSYSKGEFVVNQNDFFDRLIIVMDGELKAQMSSEDGKVINMETFGKFRPVAVAILFSEKQILPVSLFSLVNSKVFFLPKEILISCCMANRVILENTLRLMSLKVDFLSKKINFLQLNTIRQKIATVLLTLSKKAKSDTFTLDRTKEELAKDMGVTRPSLSREFMNLSQMGIIEQNKDEITIKDLDKLSEYK